jgi:hypothetical protein
MHNILPLMVESMVSALLLLTICYCWMLNRRLLKLRADEGALKATIAELITASDIAQRAISGLKEAVGDCDRTLGDSLVKAEQLSIDLERQVRSGEEVVERIARIAQAARPGLAQTVAQAAAAPVTPVASAPVVSRAASTAAAAHALVMRARERQHEVAA